MSELRDATPVERERKTVSGPPFDSPAELVEVYRTADPHLLAILKTVLDAAGIDYVVQGDGALGLLPLGPLPTGLHRNLWAATILVAADRAEEAWKLLRSHADPTDEDGDDRVV